MCAFCLLLMSAVDAPARASMGAWDFSMPARTLKDEVEPHPVPPPPTTRMVNDMDPVDLMRKLHREEVWDLQPRHFHVLVCS